MPMGEDGTLGEGIAVDKLSVGRDPGLSVETIPTSTIEHADNERDRRKIENSICLKNDLCCIGYLFKIVIYC